MSEVETKRCPQCGAILFADVERCYECMHGCEPGGGWDEEVPIEAYPEDLVEATVGAPLMQWVLRMSTASVDVAVPVPQEGLTMGRGTSCDVVLHAKSVSRQHVHVAPDVDGLIVRDMGARNPCTIGGKPVTGEAHMCEGETLCLCGATFLLERSGTCFST